MVARLNPFDYLAVTAADVSRGLYVTSWGRLRYEPGARYPCDGHPGDFAFAWQRGRTLSDFALVWIEDGRGEFEDQAGGRLALQAGDIFLIPPGAWHRYRPDRSTGWTENWVTMNGAVMHELRNNGWFPFQPAIRRLESLETLGAAMRELRRLPAVNTLLLASRVLGLIAHATEGASPSRGSEVVYTGDGIVDHALEYIHKNSHRPLTAASVARDLAINPRTLQRRFAAKCQRTVAEEITWWRLQRARLWLGEGRLSVKEIGYASGFGGSRRLIRAFQRWYGVSPGRYRRQCAPAPDRR